jgi:hypothetical protein
VSCKDRVGGQWAWNGTDFRGGAPAVTCRCLIFCSFLSSVFCRRSYCIIASRSTQHTLQAVTQDTTLPPRGSYAPFSYPFRPSFQLYTYGSTIHFALPAPPRLLLLDIVLMYIRRPSHSSRRHSMHLHLLSFLSFFSLACLSVSAIVRWNRDRCPPISADNIFSLSFSPPSLSSLNLTTLPHSQHLSYLQGINLSMRHLEA